MRHDAAHHRAARERDVAVAERQRRVGQLQRIGVLEQQPVERRRRLRTPEVSRSSRLVSAESGTSLRTAAGR